MRVLERIRAYSDARKPDNCGERWFDGDYSEMYYGEGHQDKTEFAAWVDSEEDEPHDPTNPKDVEHLWYRPTEGDPDRFTILPRWEPGAVPTTRYRP